MQRRKLARAGYTENDYQTFAKSHTLPLGEITTPACMGKEGNKKVRLLQHQTLHELNEKIQTLRGHTHIVIGIINALADFALREAIDRIKREGMFKQGVKKHCNSTQKALDIWKVNSKELMAGMNPILEDLATDRISEIVPLLNSLKIQLHNAFGKQKVKNPELAAWIEAASITCMLSNFVLKTTVKWGKEDYNIDAGDMFTYLDLSLTAGKEWQKVCREFYPEKVQELVANKDELVYRATKLLAKECLNVEAAAFTAVDLANYDYAKDFTDEQRKDLRLQADGIRRTRLKEQEAEAKANADYWAQTKRTAKPKASDVTQEDLNQLKQHFA